MAELLNGWLMTLLAVVFTLLYATAVLGWLKPFSDITFITRLEPMIFVIIGYFFGRLPRQQKEKALKEEIDRQSRKADAAIKASQFIERERELMDEKIKDARVLPLDFGSKCTSPMLNSANKYIRNNGTDIHISRAGAGTVNDLEG